MTELNPVADLTVKYVNQPKPGKHNGSVKDEAGQFYLCPPTMLSQFAPGMRCKIEYKAETGRDGTEWRTIQKVIGGANGAAPVVPKNNYRPSSDPTEGRKIAVLALAKECIGKLESERLSEESLVAVLQMCCRAYDRVLGGQQHRTDMDDHNPY